MIRILQIGMTSNYGGVESFIMNLYRHINRQQIQFDFVNMETHNKSLAYTGEIKQLGGHIFKIPGRRENPIQNKRELANIIRNGNYQYVDNNVLTWSYSAGVSLPLRLGTRVIVHSHNAGMNNSMRMRRLLNFINRRYNLNQHIVRLACSHEAGKWLFGHKPFQVISNGINTQNYQFDASIRGKYRKKFNVESQHVFLNVARLSHQKNHQYLLRLFKEIVKRDANAVLFLVGEGELHDEIVRLVSQLNLSSHVVFMGIRHDVSELMQMSDAFLFPSHYEGLGIVLVEAQATGLPCLVSSQIPKEVFVTKHIQAMDLATNPVINAKTALELATETYDRTELAHQVQISGYGIETTVAQMSAIYNS
ncbi:MAG: glycosyltransferase [Lactobacillus sp.]